MKPTRIQRRRTKGWRKPDGVVFVGRPTKWGNPVRVGRDVKTKLEAVAAYKNWLLADKTIQNSLHELRGKQLMCWCATNEPCHADVLLELANS